VGVGVGWWWFLRCDQTPVTASQPDGALTDDEPEDAGEWSPDANAHEAVVPTTMHRAAVAATTPPASLRRAVVLRGENFSARRKSCCMEFFAFQMTGTRRSQIHPQNLRHAFSMG
jgi:hypothetical protein